MDMLFYPDAITILQCKKVGGVSWDGFIPLQQMRYP